MTPTSTTAAPPVAAPATRLHLDFLDGIRGLAALVVVFHHLYGVPMGMSARGMWPWKIGNLFLYGHLAVGVFLVVSGFCLALPVASSRQLARGSLLFFGKRARRILPPFFVALILSVLIFWVRHHFGEGRSLSARDFAVNLLLLQDIFPNSNIFDPPLWSVAIEWKIYFLFPCFLWVWRRFGSLALLAAGLLSSAVGMVVWAHFDSIHTWGHSCPWFLSLFSCGILAAGLARSEVKHAEKWRAQLPWIALVASLVLLALLWRFPVTGRGEYEFFVPALPAIDMATGIAAAALIVMLARVPHETSVWKRLLEWRPLVWVGTFAYSLYLTHEPMIRLFNSVLQKAPVTRSSPLLATIVLVVVGLPVVIGAALLFFLAFERPFLSRRPGT